MNETLMYKPPYFLVVSEDVGIEKRADNPGHFFFGLANGAIISPSIATLKHDIEMAEETLRAVFNDISDPEFRRFFGELLSLAQLGLLGTQPNQAAAEQALVTFKERLIRKMGPGWKKKYLNQLGVRVGLFSFVLFLAGIWVHFCYPINIEGVGNIENYLFMVAAAVVGIWISFASRRTTIAFENLLTPEADMLNPTHRILYVIVFSLVLSLFAARDVAGVSLGDFSTQKIGADVVSAIIFGFVCGFSEKLLSSTVTPHVKTILSGLGRSKAEAEPT